MADTTPTTDAANDPAGPAFQWAKLIFAMLITLGFFGVIFFLIVYGKPAQGGDALMALAGSLGTAWLWLIGSYFRGRTAA